MYSFCSDDVEGGASGHGDDVMAWAVETILERYTQKASPIVRQAACVWLLSLVKHTSRHPEFPVSQCMISFSSSCEILHLKFNFLLGMHCSI